MRRNTIDVLGYMYADTNTFLPIYRGDWSSASTPRETLTWLHVGIAAMETRIHQAAAASEILSMRITLIRQKLEQRKRNLTLNISIVNKRGRTPTSDK